MIDGKWVDNVRWPRTFRAWLGSERHVLVDPMRLPA
jgi:hypothetical protein